MDEYVMKADKQVERIREAVKYREANYDEEWLLIVTTDHGRGPDGYHHGGQSERERTSWIATNVQPNAHFAVELGWTSLNDKATATVYAARSNNFKQGSPDRWVKVGKVKAGTGSFTYDLSANPDGFYKFAVVTPNNHLTCWAPAK